MRSERIKPRVLTAEQGGCRYRESCPGVVKDKNKSVVQKMVVLLGAGKGTGEEKCSL